MKFLIPIALLFALAVSTSLGANPAPVEQRARELYQRTEYQAALALLEPLPQKSAEVWCLIGQARFMKGDYNKAVEAFETAVSREPQNGNYMHWLGRTYGRQAEAANIFRAPGLAVKTRQAFERSVKLDPTNKEALNDLFEFYLDAPGFLGGGLNRAEELVVQIGKLDEAEGYYARAVLADKRKDFNSAEAQFRRAMELAPKQVGRVLDLAKFLARRGKVSESDQLFNQAMKTAPDSPQVMYDRAATYVKQKRNLSEAQTLLERYLKSNLTPDNEPRERALELLKQAKGG